MANLILAGKPSVSGILTHSLDKSAHIPGLKLLRTTMYLHELAPLTRRLDVTFKNGNSIRITEAAARLLTLDDVTSENLVTEMRMRWQIRHDRPCLNARRGDLLVILPMTDEVDRDHLRTDLAIQEHLRNERVTVVYVNNKLPGYLRNLKPGALWEPFNGNTCSSGFTVDEWLGIDVALRKAQREFEQSAFCRRHRDWWYTGDYPY